MHSFVEPGNLSRQNTAGPVEPFSKAAAGSRYGYRGGYYYVLLHLLSRLADVSGPLGTLRGSLDAVLPCRCCVPCGCDQDNHWPRKSLRVFESLVVASMTLEMPCLNQQAHAARDVLPMKRQCSGAQFESTKRC